MTSEQKCQLELLFSLALEINQAGKYFCFADIAPHCFLITMRITPTHDYYSRLWEAHGYYGGKMGFQAEFVQNALEVLHDVASGTDEQRHFKGAT